MRTRPLLVRCASRPVTGTAALCKVCGARTLQPVYRLRCVRRAEAPWRRSRRGYQMGEAQAERVGAATGIMSVLLVVIGFAGIPGAPAFDSSPARIQQYYVQHRHDLHVGLFIASFGFFFFVWFLGSLVSHLRGAEGREGRLTTIVFGSGPVSYTHLRA